MDSIVQQDFWATEAMINMAIMAYNLMSLLRLVVINSPKQQMLKTIRMKFLAIPAYIQKHSRKKTLKLALALKQRPAFLSIWGEQKSLQSRKNTNESSLKILFNL
ncbi:hypothetical protein HR08_04920 [Porphyromonas gulae]|uniref:Transposase DDE domain-containing protein n=1 Tax=Porphyromonas gulae TaxID=111105 RepID=A0A0A2F7F7_9PORP|nr:hypothetical protein HR08_04920 [Porphyromonas gulae]